jgi:hypothetical protein
MNMNAFGVEALVTGQFEQGFEYIAANFRSAWPPCYTKVIAPTGDFNVQSALNLAKVLVELAAEISQTLIVGGLENDIP